RMFSMRCMTSCAPASSPFQAGARALARLAGRSSGGVMGGSRPGPLLKLWWKSSAVLSDAARHGAPLALVLAAAAGRAVGAPRRAGHLVERDLRDAHARVERHGHAAEVGQFQRDVPLEAGVHEARRRVDDHREAAQAAAPLDL